MYEIDRDMRERERKRALGDRKEKDIH